MVLKQSDDPASMQPANQRKRELLDHVETNFDEQDSWRKFNATYHEDDYKFMRFLIPPGKRVLELGCGSGHLLAALQPSFGVGVDFSSKVLAKADALYPRLNFVLGDVEDPATLAGIEGPFDYIVIADTIGTFEDIDGTLRLVHQLCAPSTRIIISYYSHLWEPVLKLAEAVHLRSNAAALARLGSTDQQIHRAAARHPQAVPARRLEGWKQARLWPSFEARRRRRAPQDDGNIWAAWNRKFL